MATTNTVRFFKERYRVAIAKYDTDRHEEALTQLSELLMEQSLPSLYRLKANAALADGVDDWFLAERYRLAAEDIYDGISEVVANSATADEGRRELAPIREMLDLLADEQVRDRPRQRKILKLLILSPRHPRPFEPLRVRHRLPMGMHRLRKHNKSPQIQTHEDVSIGLCPELK